MQALSQFCTTLVTYDVSLYFIIMLLVPTNTLNLQESHWSPVRTMVESVQNITS